MSITAFKVGDKVVYPSHGVGEIQNIEAHSVAGIDLKVYSIFFAQEKMTLKVPVNRSAAAGLRPLVDKSYIQKIYETLQSKPKQGNRMWSRRAQEYDTKINSGDIIAVAEVVRDLCKNVDCDRSYSERTIYESALARVAGEIAALEGISHSEATQKLVEIIKDKIAA